MSPKETVLAVFSNREIIPLDDCDILGNKKEALKDVQKANGIPENAELIRIETNKKQAEIYKAGKVIIFRVFVD